MLEVILICSVKNLERLIRYGGHTCNIQKGFNVFFFRRKNAMFQVDGFKIGTGE